MVQSGFQNLILRQEDAGGGSTITQQLAKLLYKRPDTKGKSRLIKFITLINSKLKEWVTAVKLEKSYTKEEIMTMYLNKFEFINGAHGIEAAAQIYFNKNQDALSVEEAAVLIGMLKNPSLYNPKGFLKNVSKGEM
ncbi:MAG: transglycosylase domain-containing protein [Saprospiraceae bacterium]|nr:transglycosylase domain-containing protein [Saprospiraceae bacterium]